LNWKQLLSQQRLGRDEPYDTKGRSSFQRDHDRIVFSSAFRRMQDKTQVFPLAHLDYIRTRLTHSLEVSCVGRSLGLAVAEELISKYDLDVEVSDFGVIVASACLAHDIGNPPFGHSGEEAIQYWFESSDLAKSILTKLDAQQQRDFLKFEGNAQGFRILTRLQHPNNEGGMQLTCATIGSMMKYPCSSNRQRAEGDGISNKKFGYFEADKKAFGSLIKTLGLKERTSGQYFRHPLAFLVEAADDICYHLVDFGDGFRLGHISFEEAMELLLYILEEEAHDSISRIAKFREDKEKIEFLVSKCISWVISAVSARFLQVEESMLSGEYDRELIHDVKFSVHLKEIQKISIQKVYGAKEVIEVESAGYDVLGGLLERFSSALEDVATNGEKASKRSHKILQLLPSQFLKEPGIPDPDPYLRTLQLTDFISGMTDSYALKVYSTLTGVQVMGGVR